MDWPRTPLERLRRFKPAFCPRQDCTEHRRTAPGFRFHLHGGYATRRHLRIPRYRCLACGCTFSLRAFSTTYFLKRPELLPRIAAQSQESPCHRQLARILGCAPSTVTRQSARLGRHSMLFQARTLRELHARLSEPVVLDHFETFEFSQDLPFGVATPVGSETGFVYGLDPAPHRRTGRLSPAQRARRDARPKRETCGGYRASARRVLDLLAPLAGDRPLRIVGDGHPAYGQALRAHPARERILLSCHPNPERGPKGSPRSPQALARDRALFPVDALHAFLRHSLAHHRRETIAFGRRLNALLERMFAFTVNRNFVKKCSERRPCKETPAMRAGLAAQPFLWPWILSRRLFPDRVPLPDLWKRLYRRDWTTPVLPSNTRHRLVYAF